MLNQCQNQMLGTGVGPRNWGRVGMICMNYIWYGKVNGVFTGLKYRGGTGAISDLLLMIHSMLGILVLACFFIC